MVCKLKAIHNREQERKKNREEEEKRALEAQQAESLQAERERLGRCYGHIIRLLGPRYSWLQVFGQCSESIS